MAVNPVPEGMRTVTPYLIVEGASDCITFMKQAFDAEVVARHDDPAGRVMHAVVRIGDSVIEISDGSAEFPPRPGTIHLYVPDVDAVHAKAVNAGASVLREVENQFYGDREGGVADAFGNHWFIATHVEDLTDDEMMARMAAMEQQA